MVPGECVHDELGFDERQVRQLRMRPAGKRNHVTDRGQPRLARAQGLRIHDHVAALELHVGELLEIEVLRDGAAADGAKEHLGLEHFGTLLSGDGALHHVAGKLRLDSPVDERHGLHLEARLRRRDRERDAVPLRLRERRV